MCYSWFMRKKITIEFSMKEALELGLIVCRSCGWPPNNHFDFGKRICAHSSSCEGFKATARKGKVLSKQKKRPRKKFLRSL